MIAVSMLGIWLDGSVGMEYPNNDVVGVEYFIFPRCMSW